MLCFILLICNRSNDPGKMCRASPSQTVAVTHKLTNIEKPLFSKKLEQLKLLFHPEFILTFVLMSKEFQPNYIEDFMKNPLSNIDYSSPITRLIRFMALLNCYVEDISVSHCEASLGISATELSTMHLRIFSVTKLCLFSSTSNKVQHTSHQYGLFIHWWQRKF